MFQKQFIKNLYCCIAASFFCTSIFSQTSTRFIIKAGEEISALYKEVYKYPDFKSGKVYFSYGQVSAGKLNYNLIMGKVQFIDEKNDTLIIADEASIKLITIGTDTFYYDKENYIELISDYNFAKLGVQQRVKFLDEESIGAYGIPTSTHTIDNYNTLRANTTFKLQINKDLIFSKERKYSFSYRSDDFVIANKKNILKKFPKQKAVIENYLTQNNTDFEKELDLKNLFGFLATL